MSKRQDVLDVLQGKQPEYVPWFGDLAYWIDYLKDEGLIEEKYTETESCGAITAKGSHTEADETGSSPGGRSAVSQGLAGSFCEEGLQQMHRDLGVGFYLQGYFPFQTIYEGVEYIAEDDGSTRVTQFHTPYGDLREIWKYMKETYSWAPAEMLLKSEGDIPALKYVYEHTRYEPDYELAVKRKSGIGENGLVLVYAPKSPLMELVALRAGIETVVELSMDAQEEFEELLEVMQKKHEEALEHSLNCPADCIMVPDNLSSELVGGSLYEDYIRPVHEKWTEKIRKAGKFSFVHLDGTLIPLLTKLSKAGFDVIEAVTPKPVGDAALEDLRDMVEENTVIWGGLPGGYFTDQLSDEEFDKYVINAITYMKEHPRFVLGVADQVVPGATGKRIARVDHLIRKYGKGGRLMRTDRKKSVRLPGAN